MTDAILFDLDGTLADSHADITAALGAAFDAIGVQPAEPVGSYVDGSPLEEIHDRLFPGDASTLDEFCRVYRAAYSDERTRLYDGIGDMLGRFSNRSLAVATSKPTAVAERMLEALGIAHHFAAVRGSGLSAIPPKPAPDLVLHTLEVLRVPASRAVFVGDTARDIAAGLAAGVRTIAVTWGMGSRDALGVARPHHLVDTPAQLEAAALAV